MNRGSERDIANDGERIRYLRVEEEREAKINDREENENRRRDKMTIGIYQYLQLR